MKQTYWLTVDQKQPRADELFGADFLRWYVTMDKTWM